MESFLGIKFSPSTNTYLSLQPKNDGDYAGVRFQKLGVYESNSPFISATTDIADGAWKFITVTVKDGQMKCYVNGTAETAGASNWYFPGLDNISGIAIGRGITEVSPNTTFDEATFSYCCPLSSVDLCQLQQSKDRPKLQPIFELRSD